MSYMSNYGKFNPRSDEHQKLMRHVITACDNTNYAQKQLIKSMFRKTFILTPVTFFLMPLAYTAIAFSTLSIIHTIGIFKTQNAKDNNYNIGLWINTTIHRQINAHERDTKIQINSVV